MTAKFFGNEFRKTFRKRVILVYWLLVACIVISICDFAVLLCS